MVEIRYEAGELAFLLCFGVELGQLADRLLRGEPPGLEGVELSLSRALQELLPYCCRADGGAKHHDQEPPPHASAQSGCALAIAVGQKVDVLHVQFRSRMARPAATSHCPLRPRF